MACIQRPAKGRTTNAIPEKPQEIYALIRVLPDNPLWEWPYLQATLNYLPASLLNTHDWVITDHLTPVPNPRPETVVFYLGNEDGSVPSYTLQVKAIFTTYPPKIPYANIYTIPLGPGIWPDYLNDQQPAQRSLDLFFSGRKLHRRKAAFNAMDRVMNDPEIKAKVEKTGAFGRGMAPETYISTLTHSKIAIAPEGNFSNITFRHFEALMEGSVVISAPLPASGCYQSFPAYQLNNWDQLPGLVKRLINQPAKLRSLQQRGFEYYREWIAPKALADKIKQVMESSSGSSFDRY